MTERAASAADVAEGTFYLHFASKEQLLLGLRQRFVSSFCEALEKALARRRADDWRGRLRTWVRASLTAYFDRVALHDLVFLDYRPEDRTAMHDNPACANLSRLLSQGSAAGAFDVGDARLTAIMLFHALHGAADAAVGAVTAARRSIARNLEAFLLRVVAAT